MASFFTYTIIISLLTGVIVDIPSAIASILLYTIGATLVYCCNAKEKERLVKIYSVSYVSSLIYTLFCYIYMVAHGYDLLLIWDTSWFMNEMEDAIHGAGTISEAIEGIWKDYDILLRSKAGYMTFLAFVGFWANQIGANHYFAIQLASLTICSCGSVVVYKLLSYYINDKSYVFQHAVIISLFSLYWQYSTLILRDGLTALGFYYIIWLLHKHPDVYTLIKFFIVVLVLITLRTETGFASIMFFPMYFLIDKSRVKSNRMMLLILLIMILTVAIIIYKNFEVLFTVYQDNSEAYFSDTGSGTISFLNSIPIVGRVLSLFYGLISPMPCWFYMTTDYQVQELIRPNCYNIMQFPNAISIAFNTYIVCYLINYLYHNSFKEVQAKILKIVMIPCAVFMLLQSGIAEPRRMMGVFVVFYVFWAIVYRQVSPSFNRSTFGLFMMFFVLLQVVGVIRYL